MSENFSYDPQDGRSTWNVHDRAGEGQLAQLQKALLPAISKGQERQKEKSIHSERLENSRTPAYTCFSDVTALRCLLTGQKAPAELTCQGH